MFTKLSETKYDTEKPLGYLLLYEGAFAHLLDKEVKLLELGVGRGDSLLMWRDYFLKGTIVGLDRDPVELDDQTGMVYIYRGNQEDKELLTKITQERAPNGWDIIIDDCSHIGELTKISFWHLFEYLKTGGIYIIKDWGTGYLGGHICYPDGQRVQPVVYEREEQQFIKRFPSHDYGMVGFVKELVDECGMYDITHPVWGNPPQRPERISKMQISPGQVMVYKRW